MSDQPPFPPQTSGHGPVYSSQNAPRSSTFPLLGPSPGSVYPPQMPNYQPQQHAPYASTQSTQSPFTHQTFNSSSSAYAPSPPHSSAHPPPPRPVSHPPAFPTPLIHGVHGGYPPTNSGPPQGYTPPRAVTMPLPELPQGTHVVTEGSGSRNDRSGPGEDSPPATRNRESDEREKGNPNGPSAGRQSGVEPKGCFCTVV